MRETINGDIRVSSNDNRVEIYKIETLGALDGPGLRTVIFLQGCVMRCGYCHNADSWRSGEGEMWTSERLFDLVMRYKPYYKKSGGVTFSGGEALLQADRLIPLVKALKEEGVNIALDTSGALTDPSAMALIDLCDLVILDIKALDEAWHLKLTGHSMDKPLHVLNHLKVANKPYWIRQVMLPGLAHNQQAYEALDLLTAHPSRERLELLPYHSMGDEKWQSWQEKYKKNICSFLP